VYWGQNGPNGMVWRLVGPRFGYLRDFSDSFMKLSEKAHERAKRLTIRRLIAT
jgi:hypothetical protein